ncbi:MAG: transglutaminase family protein [Planctomycetales bacterium]|nr:transglutaminase family protein [Planctomycetales bacterium]
MPISAAPITGSHEECEVEFGFEMSVDRIHEDPRVTKPYTEEQWARIEALGHEIDEKLKASDVRLTMGGEPTFVSIDDKEDDEWHTAAVGPNKRRLADRLLLRLRNRFAPQGLLHYGQGKWYPGESLPRWAMHCYWRKDGQPLWNNPDLFAEQDKDYGFGVGEAGLFAARLAEVLGVNPDHTVECYEDVIYYTWKERRLPANVNVRDPKLEDEEERSRIARVFEQGITSPVGMILPLQYRWWEPCPHWESGLWAVRSDELFLIPGDSPMGFRLPLQSLLYEGKEAYPRHFFEADPMIAEMELPEHERLRRRLFAATYGNGHSCIDESRIVKQVAAAGVNGSSGYSLGGDDKGYETEELSPETTSESSQLYKVDTQCDDPSNVIRTALCVEPRQGRLHVFIPPIDRTETYVDLIAAVEATADSTGLPVIVEGYLPPKDSRLEHIKVTPDPGVLEVNVHPAHSWDELVNLTTGVYEDAHQTRLCTEKFDQDGSHTGTGGGNHVVMGGPTPADSPWLRRPDLLKSFLGYWQNRPSLSYLLSGKFIGPTSQAPRVDEARSDSLYELKIAFEQIQRGNEVPAWLVDRVFRHLLADGTGNTHRAEFCIDKLFSPDSSAGRLGLVEFRAFEMPPHARMSLTQQLLLRALTARFWDQPYTEKLVTWNTTIHDRWMLPHFIWQDFGEVIEEMRSAGFELEQEWFDSHYEFRFPRIGSCTHRGVFIELRRAIEPWYVLGEEQGAGYTARYVDSSVERLQVKVSGMTDPRHILTCNGRRVPLHPTGVEGEFVAGVRYRAWQPPSCLHPTIPVDGPLVFDLVDQWFRRSDGGCQYHVGHPGGLNPTTFPVNALEAESRRATRFFAFGHTPGQVTLPTPETNPEFPLTLDLRRNRN